MEGVEPKNSVNTAPCHPIITELPTETNWMHSLTGRCGVWEDEQPKMSQAHFRAYIKGVKYEGLRVQSLHLFRDETPARQSSVSLPP